MLSLCYMGLLRHLKIKFRCFQGGLGLPPCHTANLQLNHGCANVPRSTHALRTRETTSPSGDLVVGDWKTKYNGIKFQEVVSLRPGAMLHRQALPVDHLPPRLSRQHRHHEDNIPQHSLSGWNSKVETSFPFSSGPTRPYSD